MAGNPVTARYLRRFGESLPSLPEGERAEIVREIEEHIADAEAAGRPLDQVLTSLGPADTLARAYAVEMALNAPSGRLGVVDRALTVIGLIAVASLPSLIVCTVLFAVGAALASAGLAVAGAGAVAMVRPDLLPDLQVAPWVCLVVGPLMSAAGGLVLAVLFLYVRFLVRLTARTLQRVKGGGDTSQA